MLAYSLVLKCAVSGRACHLPTIWQRSSFLSRTVFSAGLPTQRSSVLSLVLLPSVQKDIVKRHFHLSNCVRCDVHTKLTRDVLLYKFDCDNGKFFKIITAFSCLKFSVLMMVSMNLYAILRPESVESEKPSELDSDYSEGYSYQENTEMTDSSRTVDKSGSGDYSENILWALCGTSFVLGYVILIGTWIYCNRSVRYLVLRKCGKRVAIVTHGAFGKNRQYEFNVNEVSARGNRAISSAVLLNTQRNYFSFLLDIKGTYTNKKLYDTTVGLPRKLK